MRVRVTITGTAGLKRGFGAAAKRAERALAGALQETGERALKAAQQVVPVNTGALRDSGYVTAEGLAVELGFTAPHAPQVHEDLAAPHDDGQAKFLETALLDAGVPRAFQQAAARRFQGGA